MDIKKWQAVVYEWAKVKGWWESYDHSPEHVASKLALIHSEVSEALEEVREGRMETWFNKEKDGKPEGFPSELADTVIRVFDLASAHGIDLEREIAIKMDYNQTRSHKHGGKAI